MEKAGLIGLVQMHYLESDPEDLSIDGKTLADALQRDRDSGLIPFWVSIKYIQNHVPYPIYKGKIYVIRKYTFERI